MKQTKLKVMDFTPKDRLRDQNAPGVVNAPDASKLVKYKEIASELNRSIIILLDRYEKGIDPGDLRALNEELNNLTAPARRALLRLLLNVRTESEEWGQRNAPPSLGKLLLESVIRKIPKGSILKGKRTWTSKK